MNFRSLNCKCMDSTTNIFLWYHVSQLFCHNGEEVHDIKCCQKMLRLNFCWFQRLGSSSWLLGSWFYHRQPTVVFHKKKMFLKILQHRKAPVPESLCKLQLYLKRDSPDDTVHWGMNPPKKHHPPLSCQVPPLKSANCRNGGGWGVGVHTMGTQRVFLWILEDFKNTFLTEHLWMAASILKDIFFIFFD